MALWIDKEGRLHDDMDGAALSLPSWPQGMVEATEEQIANANLPSDADRWSAYQSSARSALATSDTTLMRCYEAGIALPAAWAEYRKALRAIISAPSGDPGQPLPTRPAYPEGT